MKSDENIDNFISFTRMNHETTELKYYINEYKMNILKWYEYKLYSNHWVLVTEELYQSWHYIEIC